jgi:hypothetical protein
MPRETLTTTIRFRCTTREARRLAWLAKQLDRKPSSVIRTLLKREVERLRAADEIVPAVGTATEETEHGSEKE